MNEFYDCPNYIDAGFLLLRDEIERVEWNNRQKRYEAPFANNGGHYKTDTFEVRAYYWGDCDETCTTNKHIEGCAASFPNFKCGDFEVRWYKYMGRGMTMNQQINASDYFTLIDKCIESVRRTDRVMGELGDIL